MRFFLSTPMARRTALLTLLLAVSLPGSAALFSDEGQNLASELLAAKSEGRRLAVYFELPDCSGCLEMKRRVFSDPRSERDFGRQYRTVRIDLGSAKAIVDTDGQDSSPQALAQRLRIVGTPAFAFFSADGALNYRHVGVLSDPADIVSLGRFVSTAAYDALPFADYRQRPDRRHGLALLPAARQYAH